MALEDIIRMTTAQGVRAQQAGQARRRASEDLEGGPQLDPVASFMQSARARMVARRNDGAGAVDTLAELLRQMGLALADLVILLNNVRASRVWQGAFVDVTVKAGKLEGSAKHGLGRPYQGAFMVLAKAPLVFWVDGPMDKQNITVKASAAPTADVLMRLWVF